MTVYEYLEQEQHENEKRVEIWDTHEKKGNVYTSRAHVCLYSGTVGGMPLRYARRDFISRGSREAGHLNIFTAGPQLVKVKSAIKNLDKEPYVSESKRWWNS